MDSVSQLVLGAGVAHVVLGPRIGRRAIVLGAVLGTLPDMDVLVRYASAVDGFTRHRSWSHSLIILSLCTPLIALLARRLLDARGSSLRWLLAVWLVLVTHPLLDAFTVYGTQIWWPLDVVPSAWGSMFIIDPLFTLPVLAGVWLAWRRHAHPPGAGGARRASAIGLAAGCAYIGWSLVAQQQAHTVAQAELSRQGIVADALLVAPFPLTLLWRYVVLENGRYHEGYHSLLDRTDIVRFAAYDRGVEQLASLDDSSSADRLRWFTRDFVRFEARADQLIASDLRMGAERFYVFAFSLGTRRDGNWMAIQPEAMPMSIGFDSVSLVLQRMWNQDINLTEAGKR